MSKSHMGKGEKVETVKIKLVASFTCAHYQNATNIAMALAQAGRFVRIVSEGTSSCVKIYEQN